MKLISSIIITSIRCKIKKDRISLEGKGDAIDRKISTRALDMESTQQCPQRVIAVEKIIPPFNALTPLPYHKHRRWNEVKKRTDRAIPFVIEARPINRANIKPRKVRLYDEITFSLRGGGEGCWQTALWVNVIHNL